MCFVVQTIQLKGGLPGVSETMTFAGLGNATRLKEVGKHKRKLSNYLAYQIC